MLYIFKTMSDVACSKTRFQGVHLVGRPQGRVKAGWCWWTTNALDALIRFITAVALEAQRPKVLSGVNIYVDDLI